MPNEHLLNEESAGSNKNCTSTHGTWIDWTEKQTTFYLFIYFFQGARTSLWTNLTPDHNQDVYLLIANCKCCNEIVDSQGGASYLYCNHISLLLCVQSKINEKQSGWGKKRKTQ